MGYVNKVISPDEKLISIFRLHWIYILEGSLFFLFFLGMGAYADHLMESYTGRTAINIGLHIGWLQIDQISGPFKWFLGLAGFAIFWPLFLIYISTEIGLTDRRIIYKHGLILIEIQEVDLEDIRAENIIHGWFGWLFRYGKMHFDCRFVGDIYLPAVKNPYRMLKAAHVARLHHPKIDYGQKDLDTELDALEQKRAASRRHAHENFNNVIKMTFGKKDGRGK